jgi:hypothetical protein
MRHPLEAVGLIPGLSFSWRRALGVSAAQARLSRQIGIPFSRSGRQRKVGRSLGCGVLVATIGAGWAVLRMLVYGFPWAVGGTTVVGAGGS